MSSQEKTKWPVPEWGAPPFKRFLDGLDDLITLLHLSTRGIAALRGMPKIVEVLNRLDEDLPEDPERKRHRRSLEDAQRDAEFAEKEVDSGFPLLHAQTVVTLWGSLEDAFRTYLALLLRNDTAALKSEAVQRLKVRVGDLLTLDEAARAEFLVEQLDRDIAGPLRQGINRFEALLEPFGLSGSVPEETAKHLFELQHVRNLHAHRQGYADRRFCEACPWLGAEQGSYFPVTHDAVHKYAEAASQYVLAVLYRIAARGGWSRDEMDEHIKSQAPRIEKSRATRRVLGGKPQADPSPGGA